MKDPVFTINYLDITGEGVNDLVVLNKRGVHILKVSYLLLISLIFFQITNNFINEI